MGISGLLPLLREAQRKGHVKEFSGQTVGVDSYIWLYKGAFACASDLAMGIPTAKYITFFMSRARMLRHYGVEPYFVFDGGPLPSKRETELERQRSRESRRKQGVELWNRGNRRAAFEMFQKSVEATPEMARAVIEQLRAEGFRYVVAPYEADAQLAYLEAQGLISAAISEDSDLIVFGCRKIIFKLDQYGQATLFDRARIGKAKAVNIDGWDNRRIRQMCILSGCDYAASVPRVGLKTAYLYTARSTGMRMAVGLMRADGLSVPDDYEDQVERADLTFLYQRVYDPRTRSLVHVTQPAGTGDNDGNDDGALSVAALPFIGCLLEPRVAHAVATCELDPFSYLPFGQAAPLPLLSSDVAATDDSALPKPVTPSAAKSASPAASKAVKRSKSLLSFWAKPTVAAAAAAAASSSPAKPKDTHAVAAPVVVVAADDDNCADQPLGDGVVTRFRSKQVGTPQSTAAATTAAVVVAVSTGKQSRFFASHPPPGASKASASAEPKAIALGSNECADDETSQCSTAVMADTQATAASQLSGNESEDTASVADLAALSQASTVFGSDLLLSSSKLGRPVRSTISARCRLSHCCSPPHPPHPAGLENTGPNPDGYNQVLPTQHQHQHRRGVSSSSSAKRKYSLFDSLQHRDSEIPGWAAAPVCKKEPTAHVVSNQHQHSGGASVLSASKRTKPSPSSRSPNLTPLSQIKRQLSMEGGRSIPRTPPPQSPSLRINRTMTRETPHCHLRGALVDDDIVDSSDAERDAGAGYGAAVVYT
ncbi:Rad2 nuclease [Coemansia sp. RSA 1200]|nr:Rad2 nuclease [Coemansia sp. RSA 1200]